jgi:hypothetical protein
MASLACRAIALTLALAVRASTADPIIVGDIRVTGLSPTLVRVEPKGPTGWEDRTTFMVRNPFWPLPSNELDRSESLASSLPGAGRADAEWTSDDAQHAGEDGLCMRARVKIEMFLCWC